MKPFIPALIASTVIFCLTAVPVAYADTAHYTKIDCSNGYTDAWSLTIIGEWGCIMEVHGVNCWGIPYSFAGVKTPRTQDIGFAYDTYLSGTIDGHQWYAKIQMNGDGGIARAWGRQTDGTYYEIVPGS